MLFRRDGFNLVFTPVLDTGAYTSGDVLFIPTKVSNLGFDTKSLSLLKTLLVLDSNNQKQAADILFFDVDPGSIGAANAALNLTAAAFAACVGHISVGTSDYITGTNNAYATKLPDLLLPTTAGSKAIWIAGVVRSGTPTYTASGLTFKLMLEKY